MQKEDLQALKTLLKKHKRQTSFSISKKSSSWTETQWSFWRVLKPAKQRSRIAPHISVNGFVESRRRNKGSKQSSAVSDKGIGLWTHSYFWCWL